MHQHPFRRHCTGVLLTIGLVCGILGAASAHLGKRFAGNANAIGGRETSETMAEKRAERRERRIARSGRTRRSSEKISSKGATTLVAANLSRKWEVALSTGKLHYPSLGITAPVGKPSLAQWEKKNWLGLEEQMQFGLLHGVVAYPHSPEFGGVGNVVIAGHSSAPNLEAKGSAYEDIFASLPEARRGDRIELTNGNGESSLYEVIETGVIPASQTSILKQDPTKRELTLFTCYPVGTTQDRFMVRAKFVEDTLADHRGMGL